VVQAIVGRSLGDGRSLAEARSVTSQRLQALARAHDLILKHQWHGTDLREIAHAALEPFGGRIQIDGPAFTVKPDLIQPLMLVLHELATNAAKYGALSTPQGRVRFSWTVMTAPGKISLDWRESGGPKVAAASSKGFGSRLLEGAVPNSTAKLDYDPAGFSYRLDIALSGTTPDDEVFDLRETDETEGRILSTIRP
jgi:two-component sensor histidine kinase